LDIIYLKDSVYRFVNKDNIIIKIHVIRACQIAKIARAEAVVNNAMKAFS